MSSFLISRTYDANTFNSVLARFRHHLLDIILLTIEQFNACTLIIFGDCVYTVNLSVKPHKTMRTKSSAQQFFPYRNRQIPSFKKISLSWNDGSLCKRSIQRPDSSQFHSKATDFEFLARMLDDYILLGNRYSWTALRGCLHMTSNIIYVNVKYFKRFYILK